MLQKANQNLPINDVGIHRTQMQKEIILQKLKSVAVGLPDRERCF